MNMAYDPYRRGLPRSVPIDTALALRDQAQAAVAAEKEARAAYSALRRRYDALVAEADALRHRARVERDEAATARRDHTAARTEAAQLRRRLEEAEAALAAPPALPVADPVAEEVLAALEHQVQELRHDLANVRRHRDDAVQRAEAEARAANLSVLADSIDDLDRALASLPEGVVSTGVAALRERLLGRVAEAGAVTFVGQDEAFDPARHEAIGLASGPRGVVITTERRGLSWVDGPIIRPARVVVGDGSEGAGRTE